MDVRIRPVELTDHESVLRLAPRLLVGVDPSRPGPQVEAAIRGWLDDSVTRAGSDGYAEWVAVVGEVVVGFVSVSEEAHWSGEKDAWVGELMVAQEFERQGVARRLIATAEGWAVERGLGRVRLPTGAGNEGARAFYDQLGFELNEVTLTRRLPG
jgi:GNAT superfamily N-acetyltransferase